MTGTETERTAGLVTFTVTIGKQTQTFTADTTTTGDPYLTARKLTFAVADDAEGWVNDVGREDIDGRAAGSLGHAKVSARVTAAGETCEIANDTTTTGDVYASVKSLIAAAVEELREWLRDKQTV